MVLSNSTIEHINYIKDIEFEYNLKLFLLVILFIYSLAAFWISAKWDTDKYYGIIVKNFLLKIPFGVLLFFYPLFSIFLLRGVSYETFYMLMIAFYSYALIILFIAAKLGIFEFAAQMLGIKPKLDKIEARWKP